MIMEFFDARSANLRSLAIVAVIFIVAGCASTPNAPLAGPRVPMFDLGKYASVQDRLGQDEDTTVVVAISGGGFRAANLGVGALLALEQIKIKYKNRESKIIESNLLKEVDYFTTVSGGGFAPGLYYQGLLDKQETERENFVFYEYLAEKDSASKSFPYRLPAIQKTLFWRLLGYAVHPDSVGPNQVDRGDFLQDRLDRTVLHKASCQKGRSSEDCSWTLGDIFVKAGAGTPHAPYWIANATNYVNGEIFSFTPDNLCARRVASFTHRREPHALKCDVSNMDMGVPLALGMRTSSNFPVGIPATTLILADGNKLKLADGGQADNLAFYSALKILHQDTIQRAKSGQDKHGRQQRRLLILIDAFNGGLGNSQESEGSPNVVQAALRSPFLPMEALRARIRDSVTDTSLLSRSEVDSVLMNSNLAVAYINIDDEVGARRVGTTFWLDAGEQNELISAGYRQAYASLTGTCVDVDSPALKALGLKAPCPGGAASGMKPGESAAERAVIEYNYGLIRARRIGLNDYRTDVFSDFSGHLLQLRSSIQTELNRQRFVHLLSDQRAALQAELRTMDQTRVQAAESAAMRALDNGVRLRQAVDGAERYAEIALDKKFDRALEAGNFACRARGLYTQIGFTAALPRRRINCSSSLKPRLERAMEKRLPDIQKAVAKLIDLCESNIRSQGLCEPMHEFGAQSDSALRVYVREVRRTADLSNEAPDEAVYAQDHACEILDTLSQDANLVKAASNRNFDTERATVEETEMDSSSIAVSGVIERLPKSVSGLRAFCRGLESSVGEGSEGIGESLDSATVLAARSRCVLDRFGEAWKTDGNRFTIDAQSLFEQDQQESFCEGRITRLPTRRTGLRTGSAGATE